VFFDTLRAGLECGYHFLGGFAFLAQFQELLVKFVAPGKSTLLFRTAILCATFFRIALLGASVLGTSIFLLLRLRVTVLPASLAINWLVLDRLAAFATHIMHASHASVLLGFFFISTAVLQDTLDWSFICVLFLCVFLFFILFWLLWLLSFFGLLQIFGVLGWFFFLCLSFDCAIRVDFIALLETH
jgi:hypothetical protein